MTTERTARSLGVGDLIANTYRIEARIGAGGMGAVFKCRHEMIGDIVAVKVILDEYIQDDKAEKLFLKEAKALNAVTHPVVVGYRESLRDNDGNLVLVMEFVDGRSLASYLAEGRRLTPASVVDLGNRLVGGLRAAHEANVVHRDISPDNIILPNGETHEAKIIDFGIAKDLTPGDKTVIGNQFAGRVRYASPEQLGEFGRVIDERTDVYSLGMVLAEAAGLKLDIFTDDMVDAINLRRHDPVIPMDLGAGLGPRLVKMLRADPAQRDRNILDAWSAAAPAAAATPQGGDNTAATEVKFKDGNTKVTSVPRGAAGRRLPTVAAVSMAAATLAVGGYFLGHDQGWFLPADSSVDGAKGVLASDDPLESALAMMKGGKKEDQQTALRVLMQLYKSDNNGRAALAIGELYDPNVYSAALSPFNKPDASHARKWYQRAIDLGETQASQRLQQLPK